MCVLTSPLGDLNACSTLRATGLGCHDEGWVQSMKGENTFKTKTLHQRIGKKLELEAGWQSRWLRASLGFCEGLAGVPILGLGRS